MTRLELFFVAGICLICLTIIWSIGYLTNQKDKKYGCRKIDISSEPERGSAVCSPKRHNRHESLCQQDRSTKGCSERVPENT